MVKTVIPMQGAWVQSLVGTKILHVGWSKKEKKKKKIFPGPSVANDTLDKQLLEKTKDLFLLKNGKEIYAPNTYLLQERKKKKKEREKVSERQGTKN